MSTQAAMSGVPVTLQDAATTGNGLTIAIPSSFNRHKITIRGSAGVSAGAVQPETADEVDYDGDWAQIGGGPIDVLDDGVEVYTFTGLYKFLRCPISTEIADGTVTVTYEGAK